jgi:thiamine pyrophosphate-dependent acetolactate synthase large subunit-like protein
MGDLGTNFARRNGKVAVINNESLGMVRHHESRPRSARRRAAQHHRRVEVERQLGP